MRLLTAILFVIIAVAAARADVYPFRTPSGNINCNVGINEPGDSLPADIECTLYQRSGASSVPRPAGCLGDWGHSFAMSDHGAVKVRCGSPEVGGAPPPPGEDVAPYGELATYGRIVCRALKGGLDCRNADRHGFFLSRRRQLVF